MACSVTDQLNQVIDSDRRTIMTYCSIYPAVLAVAVGVSIYFHYHPVQNEPILQLAGAGISAIAFPLVLSHIRRAEALRMLRLKLRQCHKLAPSDPDCVKIQEDVNAIIRLRMGVGN